MTTPLGIEALANLGWRIHPTSQYSRAACIKDAATLATFDLDQIDLWSSKFPGCGWRVVMDGSGIWALDVDAPSDGHAANGIAEMARLVAVHGPLPPGPRMRTGGGGCVLIFKHNGEPISGKTGTPAPGIDPRRGRLTVTLPPSLHIRTRRPYSWINAPWDISPPTAPAWLLRAVAPPPEPAWRRHPFTATTERATRAVMRAVHAVFDAPPGQANETLNRAAYTLGRWCAAGLLPASEATESLYSAARQRRIPHNEARDTIKSGFTAGLRHPVEVRHAR